MPKYEAVIFDLDGTLLDTLGDLTAACNHALESFHYPTHSEQEVCSYVGNGIRLLMQRSMPQGQSEEEADALLEEFKRYYALHNQDRTRPYPGIEAMLERLHHSGRRLGIVSNKNDANVKVLAKSYFPTTIDLAVGEREGVRKKPAPDTVFELLKAWKISPDEALYVGDSDVDVETARNSGCDCAAVSWGFRSRESLIAAGAGHIFDSVDQLEAFITEGEEA